MLFFVSSLFFLRFSSIFNVFCSIFPSVFVAFFELLCERVRLDFRFTCKGRPRRFYRKNQYKINIFRVLPFSRLSVKTRFRLLFSRFFLLEIVAFSGRFFFLCRGCFCIDFQCFLAPFWLPNPSGKASGRVPKKRQILIAFFYRFLRIFGFFWSPGGPQKSTKSELPQRIKDDWDGPPGAPEPFLEILRVPSLIFGVFG